MSPKSVRIVLIVVAAVIVLAAGGRVWWQSAQGPARPNVILISIDTLRADYLSCYGHPGEITPNVDRLAGDAVRFANVTTAVPLTLPAHATMMTGLIPPVHGVHKSQNHRLAEANVTLAELLKDQGYATGAVVSSFVLDHQFGLAQGFDTYDDSFPVSPKGAVHSQRRGESTSQVANQWLDQRAEGDSFFLFVHYYDPHTDYDPPADFADQWPGDPYAAEVAYVDYCVGQVIGKLKDLRLYEDALVVLTSDHGEMLGARGERTHGLFLYESAVKVPLIIKLPGRRPVEPVVRRTAGVVDITPTICALLGAPGRPNFSGQDLTRWINGQDDADDERTIYCESVTAQTYGGNPLLALVGRQWKYIAAASPELYDLQADPDEERNLIDAYPRRAQAMADDLQAVLDKARAGAGLEPDTLRIDPARDAPNDLAAYHRDLERALELLPQGELDEVIALMTPRVAERPDVYVTRHLLARALRLAERYAEALEHYDELVDAYPDDAKILAQRAVVREQLGDLEGALADCDRAIGLLPQRIGLQYRRGVLNMKRNDFRASLADFSNVLTHRPDHIPARMNRGTVRGYLGDLAGAIDDWTEVIRLNPRIIQAWILRATARKDSGDVDGALADLAECLKRTPLNAAQQRQEIEELMARFRGEPTTPPTD